MKKFNYKFDSILKVKENFKKQAMKEVALIGKEIEAKTEKKQVLINELNQCKLSSNKTSMKVSELQFIESHIYFLTKNQLFNNCSLLYRIFSLVAQSMTLNPACSQMACPAAVSHSIVGAKRG